MNRIARFFLILPALALAATTSAHATTLTFDGLTVDGATNPLYQPVPNGYGGLNFSNFDLLNTTQNGSFNNLSFPVTSPEVIYNSFANPASFGVGSGSFTLNSFYLTGQSTPETVSAVITFLGGSTLDETFNVSHVSSTLETLDLTGVTNVAFTSGGEYFAIDNLTVNAASVTPEPSSLVLLGSGLLSVAGVARRKFRKA